MNTVMASDLAERQKDGFKGLRLTYDGTHLNGLGNQIMAAEILRALGVPDPHVVALRKRWDDYPLAVGMPELSVNDFIKLKAIADKNSKTVEEQATAILAAGMNDAGTSKASDK